MVDDVFGIVGTEVAGAYQVQEVVAEGGFGVVYRAFHPGFRASVALKCLKIPQSIGAEAQAKFLEQFRAEAELLFRLSASIPTVVRPLHVDKLNLQDGTFVPFMALEWLDGEDLDAVLQRRGREGLGGYPIKKLVRLLTPVARALERAHTFQGAEGTISIIHRDVKPENIYLADIHGERVVKVLDFGISKARSVASQVAGKTSQSGVGPAAFTPCYGSPEQWLPKRYGQTGPWTDVWGLALTFMEALTLRTSLEGDMSAMMGTALDPERRPTPRNEGVEVSDEVEAVFLRALAVDPRQRYPDAGAFWDDLLKALGMTDKPSGVPRRDSRAETGGGARTETIEAAMSSRPPRTTPRGSTPSNTPITPPPAAFAGTAVPPPGADPSAAPNTEESSGKVPTLDVPKVPSPAAAGGPSSVSAGPAANGAAGVSLDRAPDSGSAPDSYPSAVPANPAMRRVQSSLPPPDGLRLLDDHHDDSDDSGLEVELAVQPSNATSRKSIRSMPPPMSRPPPRRQSDANLKAQFAAPLFVVCAGIAVAVIGRIYAGISGEEVSIGGVQPRFIAGALVVAGVVFFTWRIAHAGEKNSR